MTGELAPMVRLREMGQRFPGAWKVLDALRDRRGVDLPAWPGWCFVPLAAGYAVASGGRGGAGQIEAGRWAAPIVALGAWRQTKGIYRFAPELLDALWSTSVKGDLPVELLRRLPEWCVYVELGGRVLDGIGRCRGFFAFLEWDANTEAEELRFVLDTEGGMVPLILHLTGGTIEQAVWGGLAEAARQSARFGGPDLTEGLGKTQRVARVLEPLVSTVLYLCSDEREIDHPSGRAPTNPTPTRTKKGARVFAAKTPTSWDVGVRIGATLRKASSEAVMSSGDGEGGTHASPRAHWRAPHWALYWTGKGRSIPVVKWRRGALIGAGETVPTAHPVEGD